MTATASSVRHADRISAYLALIPMLHHYTDLVGKDDTVYEVVADALHALKADHEVDDKLSRAFHCFAARRDVLQRVIHTTGEGTPSSNPAQTPLQRALLACDAGLCASFNDALFSLPVVLIRTDQLREAEVTRGPQ